MTIRQTHSRPSTSRAVRLGEIAGRANNATDSKERSISGASRVVNDSDKNVAAPWLALLAGVRFQTRQTMRRARRGR